MVGNEKLSSLCVDDEDDAKRMQKGGRALASKIKFNKLCRGVYALAAYTLNLLRHC